MTPEQLSRAVKGTAALMKKHRDVAGDVASKPVTIDDHFESGFNEGR